MTEPAINVRTVSVVLVDRNGGVLGCPGTVAADEPWLQETAAVVRAVKAKWNLDVTILRLLTVNRTPDALQVTYLGEVDPASANLPALESWDGTLPEDPLRLPYAKPGGPAADLAWASDVLAEENIELTAPAEQIRTWNLSSIWRLPTSTGDFWLKVVPPFFDHEGAVLEMLQTEKVPRLFAHSNARVLMKSTPGKDYYDATLPEILGMVTTLVNLQHNWATRIASPLAIGVPDQRRDALVPRLTEVIERNLQHLDTGQQAQLQHFVSALPERMRKIEACGVPDTLVHGDYHPGNWRGEDDNLIILDWGDCYIGNPLLDRPALIDRVQPHDRATVDRHWRAAWQAHLPNADIDTACDLIKPISAARLVLTYQMFLDNIEASEQIYHVEDVPLWLNRTAKFWADSTQ